MNPRWRRSKEPPDPWQYSRLRPWGPPSEKTGRRPQWVDPKSGVFFSDYQRRIAKNRGLRPREATRARRILAEQAENRGGGWYRLPNGETVRGKEAAGRAMFDQIVRSGPPKDVSKLLEARALKAGTTRKDAIQDAGFWRSLEMLDTAQRRHWESYQNDPVNISRDSLAGYIDYEEFYDYIDDLYYDVDDVGDRYGLAV